MTMTSGHDQSISAAQRRCLAASIACRDACLAAVTYCLQTRGDAEGDAHIRLLRACVDECERAIPLLRDGNDGAAVMAAVAEAAGRCTREIVHRFPDDAQLQACAHICHECATGCADAATPTVPYDESVEETFPASDPPAR